MLEHELLMLVAAPLLVLSRPVGVALWALPHGGPARRGTTGPSQDRQHRLADADGPHWLPPVCRRRRYGFGTRPCCSTRPSKTPVGISPSTSRFLVTALLFWWSVLHAPGRRVGLAVGCLFFRRSFSGALGALMALSQSPWYAGTQTWGWTLLDCAPPKTSNSRVY
jgi:hypothetical protein